jgi:hypothetical protein
VKPGATLFVRFVSAAVCGLVSLHAALFPLTSVHLSPTRVVIAGSLDESAGKAALKQSEGFLWSAAMQATWKSELARSEAVPADLEPRCPRRLTRSGLGASFARTYAPPRAHRILAPPSTNEPDA